MGRLDAGALAWAAGLFDGEGSTFVYECRPGYLRLVVSVTQYGGTEVPEVLGKFHGAVLLLGEVVPQSSKGMWHWRSRSGEEGQAVIAMLWSHLGSVKRSQAVAALKRLRAQYGPDGFQPRRPRRTRPSHAIHVPADSRAPTDRLDPVVLDRAWVAGFLDGEGCFGLVRSSAARKDAPPWHRIRASATQRSHCTGPPEVLLRLRRVLGMGRIERHGDPQAYKWVIEGLERIQHVLTETRGWLGPVKAGQAANAVRTFRAQVRLRGDATHCVRGHGYARAAMRGGRLRKICNHCERIVGRKARAAAGILPRQFANPARRYTS